MASKFSQRSSSISSKLTLSAIAYFFMAIAWAPLGSAAPNVVLILTDDQGWNGTSVQMDPDVPGSRSDFYQTPRLEELASAGIRFSNGYSASPACSPTRASIETGRSPAQLGITDLPKAQPGNARWFSLYNNLPLTPPIPSTLDPTSLTLPRIIKQSNPDYSTALVGKWHLKTPSSVTPTASGYDYWTDPAYPPDEVDPWGVQQLANIANNFMEASVNDGKPFFLQLSQHGIHPPPRSRPEVVDKYAALPPGTVHKDPVYAASTEDLDTSLGSVLDKISSLGIEDNTYVIYVSDNGAPYGYSKSTPLRYGKATLWEGGVRVPFIIKGPGIQAGSVSDVPVVTTDLYSTIAELTGYNGPKPYGVEGVSLVPLLNNGGQLPLGTDHLVRQFHDGGELYFHWPHNFGIGKNNRIRPVSAIRDGDYKLLLEYGENGAPDQVTMYNLANDLSETQNLAISMPAKTLELKAKLLNYLSSVDASLPYDVKDPVSILWTSDNAGGNVDSWRSVTELNYRARETWDLGGGTEQPQLEYISVFQPNLANHAFSFDGDDVMRRKYFHVGDTDVRRDTINAGTPDFDRSASIDMWVRLDDLNHDMTLFESGTSTAGLSLSLGDANGDGNHNELRFRILGENGESLTVTSPIDKFTNPNRDFVNIVATFDDLDATRQAKIYINGALAGQTGGLTGAAHSLEWDHYDLAGLGNTAGSLGGNSGAGDLPFQGGMIGQIAQVRFYNYAIDAIIVQQDYNSALSPADFGLSNVLGGASSPLSRPSDLSLGAFETSDLAVVQERNDRLDAALAVDVLPMGAEILSSSNMGTSGNLSAGTEFTSYLLQFDPVGSNSSAESSVAGSIEFDREILAI